MLKDFFKGWINDMEIMTEENRMASFNVAPLDVKIRMLYQMAEALEEEAVKLFRRAAIFEEEEFLLNREIEERQGEIKRLQAKLETLRGERDRIFGKIHGIQAEVAAMREEISNNEEEITLANVSSARLLDVELVVEDQPPRPVFFHRMTLS
ncbi:MAG TPA: hypothetical protein VLD57_02835 [Blastocatellia bacterium]|nr:hypothetical protein [Blastocatellia bacterium]